jgi:hypothetical protein
MAIHTLPNGAEWDDSLDFIDQSEEAQEFWENIIETIPSTFTSESTINPNMNRTLTRTWLDEQYEDFNYRVFLTVIYQNDAMHQKAFAIRTTTIERSILNK